MVLPGDAFKVEHLDVADRFNVLAKLKILDFDTTFDIDIIAKAKNLATLLHQFKRARDVFVSREADLVELAAQGVYDGKVYDDQIFKFITVISDVMESISDGENPTRETIMRMRENFNIIALYDDSTQHIVSIKIFMLSFLLANSININMQGGRGGLRSIFLSVLPNYDLALVITTTARNAAHGDGGEEGEEEGNEGEHLCATAADVLNHAVQSGGRFETEMIRWARRPTVFTIDLVGRPQKLKYLLGEFAPFIELSAPTCFLGRFHALTLDQVESDQRAKISHFASLEEARTCWKNWNKDTRNVMAEI
jgi:hypothetical protein